MKAEHRKELESNVLVHQIEKAYQGIRQGPSRTTLLWVGAAVVVLVVYVLFRIFMSSSASLNPSRIRVRSLKRSRTGSDWSSVSTRQ